VEFRIVTAAVVLILTAGVLGLFDCQHPVYVPPVVIVIGPPHVTLPPNCTYLPPEALLSVTVLAGAVTFPPSASKAAVNVDAYDRQKKRPPIRAKLAIKANTIPLERDMFIL